MSYPIGKTEYKTSVLQHISNNTNPLASPTEKMYSSEIIGKELHVVEEGVKRVFDLPYEQLSALSRHRGAQVLHNKMGEVLKLICSTEKVGNPDPTNVFVLHHEFSLVKATLESMQDYSESQFDKQRDKVKETIDNFVNKANYTLDKMRYIKEGIAKQIQEKEINSSKFFERASDLFKKIKESKSDSKEELYDDYQRYLFELSKYVGIENIDPMNNESINIIVTNIYTKLNYNNKYNEPLGEIGALRVLEESLDTVITNFMEAAKKGKFLINALLYKTVALHHDLLNTSNPLFNQSVERHLKNLEDIGWIENEGQKGKLKRVFERVDKNYLPQIQPTDETTIYHKCIKHTASPKNQIEYEAVALKSDKRILMQFGEKEEYPNGLFDNLYKDEHFSIPIDPSQINIFDEQTQSSGFNNYPPDDSIPIQSICSKQIMNQYLEDTLMNTKELINYSDNIKNAYKMHSDDAEKVMEEYKNKLHTWQKKSIEEIKEENKMKVLLTKFRNDQKDYIFKAFGL